MDSMTNYDFYGEFKDYAIKHLGVSSMQILLLGKITG